jgi:hypothetical protein
MILLLLLPLLVQSNDLDYRVVSADRVDLISPEYYLKARLIELCDRYCVSVESISDNERILQFNHSLDWRAMNITVDLIEPDGMLHETRLLHITRVVEAPQKVSIYRWYYGSFLGMLMGALIVYVVWIKYHPAEEGKPYVSNKVRNQLLAKEMGIYNE